MKFLWLLACIGAARAALVAPPAIASPTARAAPRRAAAAFVTMEDKPQYSREVQMKAEMESPLQQARFFFFYPAVVVGASLAAYVSVIRIVAGLSGARDDVNALQDAGNLLVDIGCVAASIWGVRRDMTARDESLAAIAASLGQTPTPPPAAASSDDDRTIDV